MDVSFDLPWSVFCSSIQAPLFSRFVASFIPEGVVRGTAAGRSAGGAKTTKGTWGPRGPRTPKGTAGTYGAGKVWDLCGFDKLDIFWRNMFWGLADFRWMWTDSIVWYWVGSYAVLWAQMSKRIYIYIYIWRMSYTRCKLMQLRQDCTENDAGSFLFLYLLFPRNHPNP